MWLVWESQPSHTGLLHTGTHERAARAFPEWRVIKDVAIRTGEAKTRPKPGQGSNGIWRRQG